MTTPSAVSSPNLEEDSTSHSSYHSHQRPSGSRVIRTARRTTRSPRANPYPTHTTTATSPNGARRRADVRRWNWLPYTLETWRTEEGIPIPTENQDMQNTPHTQEPAHHTIPVLAARIYRHENRLDAMEIEQHETRLGWMHLAQGRVAQIYQDQEDLTEAMDATRDQVVETREEVTALRLRLEQCELRSQEAEQYTRMLEQRLTLAEENVRQAGRLAESVDHLITLLPQVDLHQD